MTTYQKAIQILGKERTHVILINAMNEALGLGTGKVPDIEVFRPWVEMQIVNKKKVDKFEGVSRVFDRYMNLSEVQSPLRQVEVASIRHILRWYYCHFPDLHLRQAGSIVYPCDHSTAIHSREKVKDMLATKDPYYVNAVNSLNFFCAENQIFTINLENI
jgi:chromosomal replication initiation ATPase DnaA